MYLKSLFLTLLLLIGSACSSIAPTPILMGRATDLNSETVELYLACATGANYTPNKEGCDPIALTLSIDETRSLALEFISADIKQPPWYDIYLAITMMYFRIGQRNLNEYTKAEQIARQFFEVQKANSGKALPTAGFYWAHFAASTAAKQSFEDLPALTTERKVDLVSAYSAGLSIQKKVEGARKVRLNQALEGLKSITDTIQ